MVVIDERLAVLDTVELKHGAHNSFTDGMCIMEAASWIAGEPFSDHPECVSPVIGAFLRNWNDQLDAPGRQALKWLIPLTIGTADTHDEERGWMAVDWLIRVHTPAWLELAGVKDSAAALRALRPLQDLAALNASRPTINAARSAAAAARAAAWAAAWDATRAAAGAAARDKLAPTVTQLQQSAIALFGALIAGEWPEATS